MEEPTPASSYKSTRNSKVSRSYLARGPSENDRKTSDARKSAIHESLGAILTSPQPSVSSLSKRSLKARTRDATRTPRRTKSSGSAVLGAMQSAFVTPKRSSSTTSASGLLDDPFIDALLGGHGSLPSSSSSSSLTKRANMKKRRSGAGTSSPSSILKGSPSSQRSHDTRTTAARTVDPTGEIISNHHNNWDVSERSTRTTGSGRGRRRLKSKASLQRDDSNNSSPLSESAREYYGYELEGDLATSEPSKKTSGKAKRRGSLSALFRRTKQDETTEASAPSESDREYYGYEFEGDMDDSTKKKAGKAKRRGSISSLFRRTTRSESTSAVDAAASTQSNNGNGGSKAQRRSSLHSLGHNVERPRTSHSPSATSTSSHRRHQRRTSCATMTTVTSTLSRSPSRRRRASLVSTDGWGDLDIEKLEMEEQEDPIVTATAVAAMEHPPQHAPGPEDDYGQDARTATIVGENLMNLGVQLLTRGHDLKQHARRNSIASSGTTGVKTSTPKPIQAWETEEQLSQGLNAEEDFLPSKPSYSSSIPQVVYGSQGFYGDASNKDNEEDDQSDLESVTMDVDDTSRRSQSCHSKRRLNKDWDDTASRKSAYSELGNSEIGTSYNSLMADQSSAVTLMSLNSIDSLTVTDRDLSIKSLDSLPVSVTGIAPGKEGDHEVASLSDDLDFKELYDATFESERTKSEVSKSDVQGPSATTATSVTSTGRSMIGLPSSSSKSSTSSTTKGKDNFRLQNRKILEDSWSRLDINMDGLHLKDSRHLETTAAPKPSNNPKLADSWSRLEFDFSDLPGSSSIKARTAGTPGPVKSTCSRKLQRSKSGSGRLAPRSSTSGPPRLPKGPPKRTKSACLAKPPTNSMMK